MGIETLAKGKYRAELDGLRAFAVIAVIINHFNKDLLPSGYLGVDIFFVISGYVITSSLDGRKSINFLDFISGFYQRRVKRLLPALSFYILLTSILTHLFIQNASNYYLTAATSILGFSNIYLTIKSVGYWGIDAMMNPFIHTWSLGVEEQFYFIFPFLIWFSGFGKQTNKSYRSLSIVIFFISLISFIYYLYLHLYSNNQSAIYFLMPNRFWEMATGCLAFIIWKKKGIFFNNIKKISSSAVLISIIAVFFCQYLIVYFLQF